MNFQDLKKMFDNEKNGIIYFSLGSNIKSKGLPDQIKKDLLKMFGKLKYTVLWKFEEELPDLPKNVHILKWAPQPSILCKYFIFILLLICNLYIVKMWKIIFNYNLK